MPYLKNIAFTSLIKINGRLSEFNFRKRTDSLYDGDTNDERGERYFFKIEKLENQWELTGLDIPSWITQYENAIAGVVQKQEEDLLAASAVLAKR